MRRGAGKLVVVLLAVAWTVGLRVAVRWHARSSGGTMDDSKLVTEGVDRSVEVALRRGDLEAALEAYDRALDATPDDAELLRARRAVAKRLGREEHPRP